MPGPAPRPHAPNTLRNSPAACNRMRLGDRFSTGVPRLKRRGMQNFGIGAMDYTDSRESTAQDLRMADEEYDWGDEAATFGDRLAMARLNQKMDQAALARRLGVKLETVRNWENDRSEPRANRLQMIAGLLNISIIWLMTGDGTGGPSHDASDTAINDVDAQALLMQLRELRLAQTKLSERTGRIEKQLRTILSKG